MNAYPNLQVQLGPLRLPNPVLAASGTFGYGLEYADLVNLSLMGGIVVKSLTLAPRAGNPPPRVTETPAGMLNSIGLQNEGVETFLLEILPRLREYGVPIIVSVAGETVEEFCAVAEKLTRAQGIVALELNLSCPNQMRGGMEFGIDAKLTATVVRAVRSRCELPLIAKLSPNVTDIVPIAQAARDAGADILSLINSVLGLAVDAQTRRFKLATRTGGLTGAAIKPIALYHVWRVHQALPDVPLIGIGGIMSWEDAVEFLLVGASAVQIGTANFVEPTTCIDVLQGLERYLVTQEIPSVQSLIGTVQDIA
ncbi:Dihydroorotate dehydrogenase B (NAD(+)), catalytic subunit [bacterium HR15]|nr:Dihydroorotate dehydrogenase B (NAD(+)), catalytic subunit [bacterium HR15]